MPLLVELIGYIGMILVALAWALVRKKPTVSFLISLGGSIILFTYGFLYGQIPNMVLNTIFATISLYHLIKSRRK